MQMLQRLAYKNTTKSTHSLAKYFVKQQEKYSVYIKLDKLTILVEC